jgi:hypothetical protein
MGPFSEHDQGNQALAQERREHSRKQVLWAAYLDTGAATFACVILNFSQGGAMLKLAAPVEPQQSVTLVMERFGKLQGEVVWRLADKGKIGIRFNDSPDHVVRLFGGSLPF